MLKNNGLINYVLDFGGKFLFLFHYCPVKVDK